MELKKPPRDGNQVFDNSSYYQPNDPFSPSGVVNDPYGPDGMGNDYYSEQGTYDPSQNPYNQVNSNESMNPYVQSGYGRVDLNDGYYDEQAENADIDAFGMAAKTAGMAGGLGSMLGDVDTDRGFGTRSHSGSNYHHHHRYHRHYYGSRYGARSAAGAVVGSAYANEVLVSSFIYMFIALLITGTAALVVASNPNWVYSIIMMGKIGILAVLAVEFLLVFACTSAIKSDNFWLSAGLFFTFAAVNGITFSIIFLVFQLSSIVTVFFMTSVVFAVMAFYGAVTKKDLTSWGPILLGSLIAIIIGSIINIVLGNTMVDMIVTVVGVVVFSLFTAYDVNKITKMSRMNTGLSPNVVGMYGAMELYLDFINLFLKLLRLFGKRRN